MRGQSAKFGYIVEADVSGFFYNRAGQWSSYSTAAEGYVWSEDEAVAIRDRSIGAKGAWPMTPELAHPAVYDDAFGITVVTGAAVPIASLTAISVASSPAVVPDSGGAKFDVKVVAAKLGVNMMGGAMHSL